MDTRSVLGLSVVASLTQMVEYRPERKVSGVSSLHVLWDYQRILT